jgi:mevalonate kinase
VAHLGSGRAKLLLFGEHAAVYGHPAVGLSLDISLSARLQPGQGGAWSVEGVGEGERRKVLQVLGLLEDLSSGRSSAGSGGGVLLLESVVPRGLGFGSSASLCVALAAAVASWRGGAERQRIWEWAHRAEQLFHGTPSGIDTGLALLGGLYSFRPRPPGLPSTERLSGLPLHLVVGAAPRRRSTGELVGALRRRVDGGDRRAEAMLRRLGVLAARAAELLGGGAEVGVRMRSLSDPGRPPPPAEPPAPAEPPPDIAKLAELGELAREAQGLLRQLRLSTPELDRLLQEGRTQGALGGKLSGGGGGGAFFLIYPDPKRARAAASALTRVSRELRLPTTDTIRFLSWRPEGGFQRPEGG